MLFLYHSMMNQRHSDGAYFAGSVPVARLLRPRAVAVATVALPQAQSMAPWAVATGTAFCTLGLKTRVLVFRPVGIPLPEVAAI